MADNETIADIIAEMRKTKYGDAECEVKWCLTQWADRLEAAHKRYTKELRVEIERLKEERNYSGVRERERLRAKGFAIVPKEQLERGNCAKLREALEMVRDAHYTKEVGGELYEGFEVEADDGTGRPLICIVKDALAAPARNCDRFNTGDSMKDAKDAYGAWERHCDNPTIPPTCKVESAFKHWLFATATKEEGGNK